ncbi:hypothetical protein HK097_004720 [Rhizophlyctis rosea]|uniref:Uncharacterized protein n=1 Tax=Rhizophlyctis rosea TaxID=64517 RepID=A0AAD5SFZ3_9FUNG|nr:hypothetical protein HK097_004720 [Rhizophlyctis rosea]
MSDTIDVLMLLSCRGMRMADTFDVENIADDDMDQVDMQDRVRESVVPESQDMGRVERIERHEPVVRSYITTARNTTGATGAPLCWRKQQSCRMF